MITADRSGKTVRVLVVDDQAGMRLTLKGILSKKGYHVSLADSGESAIEMLKTARFDVIFMDIKMPGLSGVEALARVKELNPDAVVIMMTAYAVEDDVKRALREGAYTVLTKPFEIEKTLQLLQECLQSRALVMVVDDRLQDRHMLKTVLEQRGYRVVAVENGEECLRQLGERRFQIVILDIKLPGMDGLQTLKSIKELRPDAAVVMITGYSAGHLVEETFEHGSHACLTKPVDIDKLLILMDNCLAARKD